MASEFLVVIDMQNDFISGSLKNDSAMAIVPAVKKRIEEFEGKILFTRDTHCEDYLDTLEGRNLPVEHCIKGSSGWEIIDELKPYAEKSACIYDKRTFGSLRLAQDMRAINEIDSITSIEIIGVCTDICVISNAMLIKAAMPDVPVRVRRECCAGTSDAAHENALNAMKGCQIEII